MPLPQLEKHYNIVSLFHLLRKHFKAHTFNNDEKHRVRKKHYDHIMLKPGITHELSDSITLVAGMNSKNPTNPHAPPHKIATGKATQLTESLS